jgi:hypothetical protein
MLQMLKQDTRVIIKSGRGLRRQAPVRSEHKVNIFTAHTTYLLLRKLLHFFGKILKRVYREVLRAEHVGLSNSSGHLHVICIVFIVVITVQQTACLSCTPLNSGVSTVAIHHTVNYLKRSITGKHTSRVNDGPPDRFMLLHNHLLGYIITSKVSSG